jgi:hypothetical protein
MSGLGAGRWIVMTTINPPATAVEKVSRLCRDKGWSAVVIGDTRTPKGWHADGIDYLDVATQKKTFGDLADAIPYRHYSRKNLGFLYAVERGASLILEMDDDNIPYDHFGEGISEVVTAGARVVEGAEWVNIYRHFLPPAAPTIWPRGLPLDAIHVSGDISTLEREQICPVQQYLADHDPDVDAIYRLIHSGPLSFEAGASPVVLGEGVWVPFNAQNTLFFAEAFALTYLPCHVSFRMTDIWRSFVALAALSVHGRSVSFHTATVDQQRNVHDLMRDFEDEVPGYINNRRIGERLREAARNLKPAAMTETALLLWRVMIDEGFVPESEWPIVTSWFGRIEAALASRS